MRHTLTSGEWIELRPIQALKAKDKDAYEAIAKIYISFDADGKPDMSKIPFSMSLASLQRVALLSRLLIGWSFKYATDDDEVPAELRGQPLPLPRYENEEVTNAETPGEIPIDDWLEIEDILDPYLVKVRRKPDPKGTTTGPSKTTSTAPAGGSPKV